MFVGDRTPVAFPRLLLVATLSVLAAASAVVLRHLLALLPVLILGNLLVHLRHLRIIEQVLQRQELLIAEVAIEMLLNLLERVLHI